MYLSARERLILDILLRHDETVGLHKIAEQLGVSVRTIQRDLEGLQVVLKEYDLKLIKQAGMGIAISGLSENKKALSDTLEDLEIIEVTANERRTLIISKLLEASEPIKLVTLTNEFDVSVVTISHDLNEIEDWFGRLNLELVRKRSYGIEVTGPEKTKRLAIMHLLTEVISEEEFISLIIGKANLKFSTLSKKLLRMIDIDRISDVEHIFSLHYNSLPYTISDNAYSEIVVYLALAIVRIKQDKKVEMDSEHLEQLKHTKEFDIAEKIAADLEARFNVKIPETEKGHIAIHLRGAKLTHDQKLPLENLDFRLAPQIKKFIKNVDQRLGSNMSRDKLLFQGLLIHLERAIYRIQNQMKIHNPVLDQIQKNYEDLFLIIREVADKTFPTINFPDDEIGYLVMHFGSSLEQSKKRKDLSVMVVCSSGLGSSKMLANRIRKEIPEITNVYTTSLLELPKLNFQSYDLILSTVSLPLNDEEYIMVNPLLTEEEIIKVQEAIDKKRHQDIPWSGAIRKENEVPASAEKMIEKLKRSNVLSNLIVELLTTFQFSKLSSGPTMEHLLGEAARFLESKQLVTDSASLVFELKKREAVGGLGIPGTKLAFYHCKTERVTNTVFGVFRLDEPIKSLNMDNKDIEISTILMLLAPKDIDHIGLELMSFVSSLIIDSDESIHLFESGNAEEILGFLGNHLDIYFNSQ